MIDLRIEDFVNSLPDELIEGDEITLSDDVIIRILKLASAGKSDVFYHLGCGAGNAIEIASKKFGVRESVGIDIDPEKVIKANDRIRNLPNARIINQDIVNADISKATVILFWFTESEIINKMISKFENELQNGARVVTIWAPPDMMLPSKTDFPFFICEKPFSYASDVVEQIKAIYGTPCLDFTASWMLADKYIDAIGSVSNQYRRFVNILYSMIIWLNAWNMGVACEEEIPPPVDSYIGILRTFFDIDLADQLKRK